MRRNRTRTRSIHDADRGVSTRPRRRPILVAAGLAGALAVGAGVAAVAGDGVPGISAGGDASVLTDAPVLLADGTAAGVGAPLERPTETDQVRSQRVDLVMDGWSYATVRDQDLTYSVAGGRRQPLLFAPASEQDVRELQKSTPQIVTGLLARLATNDSSLKCTTDACTGASGQMPVQNWLLDPASIPTFGDSYAGYDITSGAYVASINVPVNARTVEVAVAGGRALSVPAGPWTTGGTAGDPTASNGYWRNRYPVAAAFGRLFHPEAAWLTGEDTPPRYVNDLVGDAADGAAVAALQAAAPSTVATTGLRQAWWPASAASFSQLTYFSSPTTGCGTGVVCTPTSASTAVHASTDQVVTVCGPSTTKPAPLVISDVRATVDYQHPTHQLGLWGGVAPDTFPGAATTPGLYGGGLPPLASGPQEVRWVQAVLADGTNGSPRVVAGRTDTLPEDIAAALDVDELLTHIKLAGETFHRC